VTLAVPVPTSSGGHATVYSPESGVFQGTAPVSAGPDGTLFLDVPSMRIYSVVVLE
jgi:hypothetical protein